jgi:epoxyqueuosine reductase
MTPEQLTSELKERAQELGFDLAGACPAVAPEGLSRLHAWLEAGYAGEMEYLPRRADAYEHPRHVLSGVKSLLVLAMNYHTGEPAADTQSPPGTGRVSRYAWGSVDYHDLIRGRLHALAECLRELVPGCRVRGVVDTAPLLEREAAQLAGLGWIGKNTMLLNKRLGSWFFLAVLLTDVELAYDEPHRADHCGTCRACLDACPTAAFPAPYVLDARRCISYATIEQHSLPDAALRADQGGWLFGCDVCQDVCPWNHRAPLSTEPAFRPVAQLNPLELAELFILDDRHFRERFRHTPLWRPKRRGILRSAAIVLGNRPDPSALPALVHGLSDAEPQVRAACAWALGRYADPAAAEALRDRRGVECDEVVLREIGAACEAVAQARCGSH